MTTRSSREQRAAHSTAVFTVFNYAGMAASFVSVPLLLRWLGRENYGLMLTALAFMNYLSFTGAGLNWGSIVLISEAHGRGDRSEMARIFRHSLVLGAVSAFVAGLKIAGSSLPLSRRPGGSFSPASVPEVAYSFQAEPERYPRITHSIGNTFVRLHSMARPCSDAR